MADIYDFYPENDLYKTYLTRSFADIFPSAEDFLTEFKESSIPVSITDTNAQTLYYLLYSKYGNSHIANSDENQFKYKVWNTIFMYGPTWEKRLEVQKKLRELSDDEILVGSKAIYNHAFNPSVAPSTQNMTELPYINDQNTTNFKRSKLDAYTLLLELLETDVTEEFIDKFRPCFKQFVRPEKPILFVTEVDEEG